MSNTVYKKRIESLDILRGLIMVLMVLDHVRDIWFKSKIDPTDIGSTNYMLFTTRWITHICAPMFFLLAGASIGISIKRGKSKKDASKFLIIRGIFLILLEIAVFTRLWMNSYDVILLQVLWALGVSMIILSGLIWFDDRIIAALSIVQIIMHNMLSLHTGVIGSILHNGKSIISIYDKMIYVLYPLIPWVGIMAIGYLAGKYLLHDLKNNQKVLLLISIVFLTSFILLRYSNLYGDPSKWRVYDDFGLTMISFINCEKYPPSLLFLLMTLGIGFLLIYLIEKLDKENKYSSKNPLLVFGRVPLFFYIIHLPLIIILKNITGIKGVELQGVYIIWIVIILVLYPICKFYGRLKKSGRFEVLKYI